MRPELRPVMIALLAGLALAGCQEKKQAPAKGTAGGEVLPGTVSDAMLPIDTVRSQPPLAPKSEPSGAKSGKAEASGKPAAERPARVREAEPQARDTPEAEPAADE